MTKSHNILATRRAWTPAEERLLQDIYPDFSCAEIAALLERKPGSVYQAAHRLGLKKSSEFYTGVASGRVVRGRTHPSMIASRFKPGMAPWNKGTKGLVGTQEACRATQFKAGAKPHNTLPIGSYRLNPEGHLQRKISDAKGSNSKRWRGVAELVWCAAHGPLPAKHIVVFKRGMFSNRAEEITLDRVECVSLAENAMRNNLWKNDPELMGLYQLKGAIKRQVNRIKEVSNHG